MGFRFRKSIRLGKSLRLNFSSKGIGYSIGGKGFRYTRTATGKHYNTFSIPGTGISYRQSLDTKSQNRQSRRTYSSSLPPASSNVKTNNGKKNIPVYIISLIFIAVFIVIIGNTFFKTVDTPNSKSSNNEYNSVVPGTELTPVQILTLQDHPHLFDSVNSFESFYDNVRDNRVQLITNQQHGRISMSRKSFEEDRNVLYLIKDGDDVDHLEFNIISSEASSLTDKDVAQIVLGYLPDGFWDYYKTDAVYISGNQEVKIYTYSARLDKSDNEKFAEAISKGYPFYFHFKIFNYNYGAYWRGETGFAAYGGVGKGQADKFPKWDITI